MSESTVTASSEMSRMHELSAKQGRHITELRAENGRLLVEKRKAEAAAGEQICLNSKLEAENERLRKALCSIAEEEEGNLPFFTTTLGWKYAARIAKAALEENNDE